MLKVKDVMNYIPSECDVIYIHENENIKRIDYYEPNIEFYVENFGELSVESYYYESGEFHVLLKISYQELKETTFELMNEILKLLRKYDKNISYYSLCFIDKEKDNDDDMGWFNVAARTDSSKPFLDFSKRW